MYWNARRGFIRSTAAAAVAPRLYLIEFMSLPTAAAQRSGTLQMLCISHHY
jgi:hypothetical protein